MVSWIRKVITFHNAVEGSATVRTHVQLPGTSTGCVDFCVIRTNSLNHIAVYRDSALPKRDTRRIYNIRRQHLIFFRHKYFLLTMKIKSNNVLYKVFINCLFFTNFVTNIELTVNNDCLRTFTASLHLTVFKLSFKQQILS